MRTAPVGATRTLGDDLELVAGLEVSAHVDAILVDVGERPGELLAGADGAGRSCALASIASYRFDAIVPPTTIVSVVHGSRSSSPVHASPDRRRRSNRSIDSWSVTSDGVESVASELDRHRHAGGNAPLIERRGRLQRARQLRCRSDRRGAAASASDSPRSSVSKRSFHDGVAACATSTSAGFRSGIGKLGGKAKRAGKSQRDKGIQGDPDDAEPQSICLRMNVGISMSLRSCDSACRGQVGRGPRGASVRDWRA